MNNPQLILLFSGKRKSGKDFICEKLKLKFGDVCTIVHISEPLKRLYAENHNLDIAELMTDGPYKEKYRLEMINWSDEIRTKNKGYFCKSACETAQKSPLWIVCDVRRKTDVEWFQETYNNKIKFIRIKTDLKVREERGWKFTNGIDDVNSECDLDDFQGWDLEITNNSEQDMKNGIKALLGLIKGALIGLEMAF